MRRLGAGPGPVIRLVAADAGPVVRLGAGPGPVVRVGVCAGPPALGLLHRVAASAR